MKRSKRSAPSLAPDAIGSRTRELVARWLVGAPLRPRDGFLDGIERLASTLALWGAHTNLTASPGDPGEIAFHIMDSLAPIAFASGDDRRALEASLSAGASVLDIGAGAGFPGLVLAAAFDAHCTLVESRRKRASYLEVASREMGLRNVTVDQRRVGPHNVPAEFDLVTARAAGSLAGLYRIAVAALRPNGVVLVYASAGQNLEEDAARGVGLIGPATWKYRVVHKGRGAARTAAMWRTASKG